jgi:hypothetical protein
METHCKNNILQPNPIQAGLDEISLPIFLKHCATSVKYLVVPANMKTIAQNIHLILNCTEIKAQRFVDI